MNYFNNHFLLFAAVLLCHLSYGQQVPPPSPCPPPDYNKVYVRSEVMPRFPGCEDLEGNDEEKAKCAVTKMNEYIYTHLKYPEEAKKNGVQGQVVLKFVVTKEGKIIDIEPLRDPGAGLGDAAKEVVMSMNDLPQRWSSGKMNGIPVNVWYTLPIKFSLDTTNKK
jgi:TonB family protein